MCANNTIPASNLKVCSECGEANSATGRTRSRSLHPRGKTSWEVDWTYPLNTGTRVWARNLSSHIPKARVWHFVTVGYLRDFGVNVPVYRADSWEVDWDKRQGKKVWARNPRSKIANARQWHWVDQTTITRSGIQWKKKKEQQGRYIDSNGYVCLTRFGMTDEEIALAEEHNLFRGSRKTFVREHHLVAVKKYKCLPPESVVRHVNGIKSDNHPDNLVLGTTQENTMDHNSARLQAIFWREKYEELFKEFEEYKKQHR